MGKTKNFYTELQEKESYINLSIKEHVYPFISSNFTKETDYTINHIKEKNEKHKEDERLKELYKQRKKITSKILEVEQELNHK